ncbi:DUF488 domain-containing protein [Glutamicibacter sp.]|uniref:DUF488 domain-containing protein n=1 Tax=Glutamicibacter sp. TaxID=1931995 RepID=UPI002B4A2DBC|nr:DUF488 domain-containing protein [Glutamicibacter sp.]
MSHVEATQIFTIGHSNRTLEEFVELLQENAIEQVIDVRKLAGSAKFPHFNFDALATSLAAERIDLRRLEPLQGRRTVSKTIPFEVNAWWENRSFHNYADHALSPDFVVALDELSHLGAAANTVAMCSEAVWWRCHRRIIADHLLARKIHMLHIMGPGKTAEAQLSAGAVLDENATVRYPEQA